MLFDDDDPQVDILMLTDLLVMLRLFCSAVFIRLECALQSIICRVYQIF